uniref:(northern house mosquito) hypothetical protein n=1 Tax=Culex pipiens TaxID=7175 RepID=A0A8D8AZG7_CULPI
MVLLLEVAFRFSGSRQLGHNQQRPAESRNGLTTVLSKFAHLRCTLVEQISQRTRGERFAALPRQTSASQLLDFGILDKLPIKCYWSEGGKSRGWHAEGNSTIQRVVTWRVTLSTRW